MTLGYFPARGTCCTYLKGDLVYFVECIYNSNWSDVVFNFRHSTIVCNFHTEKGEESSTSVKVISGTQENQYSSLPVNGARQGSCTPFKTPWFLEAIKLAGHPFIRSLLLHNLFLLKWTKEERMLGRYVPSSA